MPRYRVTVAHQVTEEVVLDAANPGEARRRAMEVVDRAHGHTTSIPRAARVDETAKDNTYRCAACGVETFKRQWGPGWVTCPRCGARE